MSEFFSNAIKYFVNSRRVSKLRKKGATIGKNVVICKGCKFDNPQNLKIRINNWIWYNYKLQLYYNDI